MGERAFKLVLTFRKIEEIIGRPLPRSAHVYPEWWNNENPVTTKHVQSSSWQAAGYQAVPDLKKRRVVFRRSIRPQEKSG